MKALRIIAALALACPMLSSCGTVAISQTSFVHCTWVNPTTREDGSPYDPTTEQGGTRIMWGPTSGGPYTDSAETIGIVNVIDIPNPPTPGVYFFIAMTMDKSGRMSRPSPEVAKQIGTQPNPSPPSGLAVT